MRERMHRISNDSKHSELLCCRGGIKKEREEPTAFFLGGRGLSAVIYNILPTVGPGKGLFLNSSPPNVKDFVEKSYLTNLKTYLLNSGH